MKNLTYLLVFLFFIGTGCSDGEESQVIPNTSTTGGGTAVNDDWMIPESEVFDGGPGKDGIPSVDNPNFTTAEAVNFISPDDLVVAINYNGETRAYPHPILDWHEIVNDKIGDISLALTYCPLTGTGIGWDRNINGIETTFGVSGLLYNANLLPYDRATDSYWSQMRHDCVKGDLVGTRINTYHVVEMAFRTFQEMYPQGSVLNTNTGFNRSYGQYPYGSYRTSDQLIFPVQEEDNRLHRKERVLGIIIENKVQAYTFETFPGSNITLVENQVDGTDLVVVGSTTKNFMTAYNRQLADGTILSFEAVQNQLPVVMKDNEGTEWDAFGVAINGPRAGTSLAAPLNYIGYWFAWSTFNQELDLN